MNAATPNGDGKLHTHCKLRHNKAPKYLCQILFLTIASLMHKTGNKEDDQKVEKFAASSVSGNQTFEWSHSCRIEV